MATNPRTKNTVEIDCPYDVGDIYMTKSERKPWDRWPGTTWYQIQGVFMLAAQNEGKYINDTWGGEEYHTLTINEMPSHSHRPINLQNKDNGVKLGYYGGSDCFALSKRAAGYDYNLLTESVGGDQPHNNMPPYNTCYIYQRLT